MAAAFAAPSAVAVRRPAAAATTTARPAAPLGTCAFTPAAGAARLAAAVARPAGVPPPPTGPTAPVCDGTVTFPSDLDGTKLRVGIVSARWRDDLTGPMVADVLKGLAERSVKDDNIVQMEVPGCGELPVAARLMMATQKVDVVIAVGVLIDGATDGYTFMCEAVSNGLMNVRCFFAGGDARGCLEGCC